MPKPFPTYDRVGRPKNGALSRRSFLVGSLGAAAGLAVARRASATVAYTMTLAELVVESTHVFVGTPSDAFSQWENIGGQKRIVTYNSVDVESVIDGRPSPGSSVTVRTLGGVVGDIGQVVAGEAPLQRGVTAAMFVAPITQGLFAVTGMAQGHYPLSNESTRHLHAYAHGVAMVGAPEGAAVRLLEGRTVSEAETLVRRELSRGTH